MPPSMPWVVFPAPPIITCRVPCSIAPFLILAHQPLHNFSLLFVTITFFRGISRTIPRVGACAHILSTRSKNLALSFVVFFLKSSYMCTSQIFVLRDFPQNRLRYSLQTFSNSSFESPEPTPCCTPTMFAIQRYTTCTTHANTTHKNPPKNW